MITIGTRRQKNVWLRSDICFEEFREMLCKPWYKADNVNIVKAILRIADVLVKAALSKVPADN
jgi:hypothetical protein